MFELVNIKYSYSPAILDVLLWGHTKYMELDISPNIHHEFSQPAREWSWRIVEVNVHQLETSFFYRSFRRFSEVFQWTSDYHFRMSQFSDFKLSFQCVIVPARFLLSALISKMLKYIYLCNSWIPQLLAGNAIKKIESWGFHTHRCRMRY